MSAPTTRWRSTRPSGGWATASQFVESNYDAVDGADALAIVTDWNEYRHPDFGRIKQALRRPSPDRRTEPVRSGEDGGRWASSTTRSAARRAPAARPPATLVA